MRTTWHTALALVMATGIAGGCTQTPKGEPVATRPSLTIYPVEMAGEARADVAAVLAVFLEKGGLESIEVDEVAFAPDPNATFDEQAAAFAAHVNADDLPTEYALYSAVIGSPQQGVEEIRAVLVDANGRVAWSDRQTRESRAMKRAKPADPMSCTMFIAERLRDPLDLSDPMRSDAPEGRWAQRLRSDSLAPGDAEYDRMKTRVAALRDAAPTATVLVFPARAGDGWSVECARRLADELNRKGILNATVADERLEFEVEPSRNQQMVLWSGARSIQQHLRANPPDADYVLVADYLGGGGHVGGVHTFVLDAEGDWVIVDFQNSHHDDFNAVAPESLADCCDLSVVRMAHYLGS